MVSRESNLLQIMWSHCFKVWVCLFALDKFDWDIVLPKG